MTYRALFVTLCLAASGLPVSGQETGAGESPVARLPNTVDDFFARAVDEGLLLPAGPEVSVGDMQAMPAMPAFICPDPHALDFSAVANLRSHAGMVAVLVGLRRRGPDETTSGAPDANEALKARLAVGLYAELLAETDNPEHPNTRALIEIARFMDSRNDGSARYLEGLAACSAQGVFWASLPALERADMSGLEDFRTGLSQFRLLPFFLRVDVTAMVAPRLAEKGQQVLVEALMASFDEADFAASAQLRFVAATLAMYSDRPSGVAALREQMRHPQFRDMALSRLANMRAPISMAAMDVLQSDMAAQFADSRSEADRLALIDFWNTQALLRGDISILEEMFAIPRLSDPVSQDKIAQGLSDLLAASIEGESEAAALHALGFISSESALAQMARSDGDLMTKAVNFANRNEMPALARHLAGLSVAPLDPGAVMGTRHKQAELALAVGDHQAVIEAALEQPGSRELVHLAVLAALRSSDAQALNRLLANAQPSPGEALTWLEEDVIHGSVLLPDDIVSLARSVEGSEDQRRLLTVERLRSGPMPVSGADNTASFADLLKVLEQPDVRSGRGG